MTFPNLARCGLLVIALHNAEEAVAIPRWLPPRLAQIEARFGIRPLAAAPGRLYVGLVLVTVVPMAWVALASRAAPRSAGAYSILVLYGIFLANAFVPHLLGVVLLKGYVPGAITAGLLVVPFAVWLGWRAIADRYASTGGLAAALLTGTAVYVPAGWALLGA
jgi:predicted small integral membrane protein